MDGKCPRCGSMMWTTASAKYPSASDLQKRLAERFGDHDRYFSREFDLTRVVGIPDFDEMLQALSDFLQGRDMKKVVFLPRGWWIRCEHCFELGEEELAQFAKETGPVKFATAEDALKFLRANMVYGTLYDYYVIDEGLAWAVTVCNDMELHIAGSKELFDSITDYGDAAIPEDQPVSEAEPKAPAPTEKKTAPEAGAAAPQKSQRAPAKPRKP